MTNSQDSPSKYDAPEHPERSRSKTEEEAAASVIIPGPSEEVADDIAAVSVEGRPGDPKSGPNMLRAEIAAIGGLVIVAAIVVGLWFGWAVGIVVFAIGAIGILFNPVVAATLLRANEREEVVDHRTHNHGPAGGRPAL